MKKLLIFAISALLFTGCTASTSTPKPTSDPEPTYPSEVSLTTPEEAMLPKLVDSSVKDMLKRVENKESFVVYFGFEGCPWCAEAKPILKQVMVDYDHDVYYIDTRKNPEWTSNTMIDDYDKLTEFLGDELKKDDEGTPRLYTPYFIFIKDGEVVMTHQGTVEGYDAHERKMTDEEKDTFKATLGEGFIKVFSQTE